MTSPSAWQVCERCLVCRAWQLIQNALRAWHVLYSMNADANACRCAHMAFRTTPLATLRHHLRCKLLLLVQHYPSKLISHFKRSLDYLHILLFVPDKVGYSTVVEDGSNGLLNKPNRHCYADRNKRYTACRSSRGSSSGAAKSTSGCQSIRSACAHSC